MPPDSLVSLDRTDLPTQAASKIREYILRNGLKAGDMLLTETELSERLGVSRSTVREALRSLKSSGVLESIRGSGTRIKKFDFDEAFANLALGLSVDTNHASLVKLAEARYVTEVSFAPVIAANVTDDDISELTVYQQKNASAKSRPKQLEWDMAFHRKLIDSSHNKYLLATAIIILEWFSTERTFAGTETAPRHAHTIRGHLRIIDACRRRDAERLEKALRDHLALYRDFPVDVL